MKLVLGILLTLLAASPAVADVGPDVTPNDPGDYLGVLLAQSNGGQSFKPESRPVREGSTGQTASSTGQAATPTRLEYRSSCSGGIGNPVTGAAVCPANTCPAGQTMYRLWQVSPPPERPLGLTCTGGAAPAAPAGVAAAPPPPQVTAAMVLQAFRRVPVPQLRSISQPAGKTLINFDTIFYTQAEPLTRTVTLLGQQVRLEIQPAEFTWEHGDGTSETTTTPGAAYPSKEVVHRYQHAHTTVQHRVVVTWTAQWSLNGGPLQPVPGTVTTTGPLTPLRIAEASPALSGQGR